MPERPGPGRDGPGRARFLRYSGGDPLAPPVDLRAARDAIGESVMAGTSAEGALREFLRRGARGSPGLDQMRRKAAQKKQELLRRHDLGGTLEEIEELLEKAVLAERGQLARDTEMDELDRTFSEMRLENLPASPAAAVKELRDYEWHSTSAREDYQRIQDLLGREMLDQRFGGMKEALQDVTDADREAITRMMRDLDALLDKHRRGEDTPEDFARFMAEHGRFFPEAPRDIEELIDVLATRSAAAQRMFNSMTEDQRRELMELSAQAFGSPELMESLSSLDEHLQALRPDEDWTGSNTFSGDEGLGFGEGIAVMQEIAELEALAEQLSQGYSGARLDDLDFEALARHLGEEAVADARTLQEIEQALRREGSLERDASGRLQLSPAALRKLGASLLADIVRAREDARGRRERHSPGSAGDLTGATRPWEFGDTGAWDIPRTVLNATRRRAGEGDGSARLTLDDVEVAETESRTKAAVALLADTSFSMDLDGRWVPMKRTALALHTLLTTRFRGDDLQLIGFGPLAREMEIEELTALEPQWTTGTNLHHALLLANRHFRRHPQSTPVLLVVTDGEPTSHIEADGRPRFSYPPLPQTIALTVRELETSVRLGAHTTFFRLGDDPGLARFIASMARKADGTVVAPELDELGAAVVDSYLDVREGRVPGRAESTEEPGGFSTRGFWVDGA